MPNITNELINEIRNNTDIVEIVSNYVPLTKKGKNYFGVCPFHDDHSPSMSVSSDKQIYKCFSCGANGNVFTFVSEYEHISFIESVKLLGNKLGYNLDNVGSNYNKDNKDIDIYKIANKFFQNNLNTSLGKNANEYLEKRGINKEIIKKFEIGLSLNKNKLTELLLSKNYSLDKLIDLGLTTENSNDFFMNRIIFPIWNLNGEVVAFSGRIYNTNDNSKYVNSKETSIFKKGQLLYNYHNVKEVLKKNDKVILMEGFMDVIRASSVGINNCVASLGTSVTKEQLNILKKMSDNIILCFDGDEAGKHATIAVSSMLEDMGINAKIIRLEDNMDPDEYILKRGVGSFISKLDNPITLIDFKMQIMKENRNFGDINDISEYVNLSLLELNKIDDDILIELTLKKMALEFNIEYNTLKDKFEKLRINKKSKKEDKVILRKNNSINKYEISQCNLLFYMIKDAKVLNMVKNKVLFFPNDNYRHLSSEIIYYFSKYGIINVADFISYAEGDIELKNTLNEIINMTIPDNYKEEEIDDYIKVLNSYNKENKIKELENKLLSEVDLTKQIEIMTEIKRLRSEINDRRN